ncbi:uncharacterized protein Z519_08678 [Cladophialophora bantiana CBS 173.52]|uniref:SnoaL-like domain-containing protein n=1 Tax=Cladophialophora bantiana (strain ATCC 10958 / CBS 173.52 / CDC B-1940 / NIH 8579) TaxID=1442370 RepID=A0A0D2HJF8_CLAB1|nr:uncharacterized protein Z519_08678 [Cladophialophora bantiana CBS 173.52]KIW90895.1 hypothetical protein Z519_08678 [Cladophialophora bantiana CBS 173.52]
MSLANTIWSSDIPVPTALRDWLEQLFTTVDSKSSDSGELLAALYTPNATVFGLHGNAEGSEAIKQSRKTAWDTISSRKHEVLQVYPGQKDYSDLMLIGRLTAGLKNEVVTEFIAQIHFQGDTSKDPKGTLYKVWGCTLDKSNADLNKL